MAVPSDEESDPGDFETVEGETHHYRIKKNLQFGKDLSSFPTFPPQFDVEILTSLKS